MFMVHQRYWPQVKKLFAVYILYIAAASDNNVVPYKSSKFLTNNDVIFLASPPYPSGDFFKNGNLQLLIK